LNYALFLLIESDEGMLKIRAISSLIRRILIARAGNSQLHKSRPGKLAGNEPMKPGARLRIEIRPGAG
jgi:hypothetical protein